jgi:HD-GYP domain-containing protein (c-di-GMP phosphodiesterase class II)
MLDQTAYPELRSVEALTVALEVRDAYTRSHCDRLVALAGDLGEVCGVATEQKGLLGVAARFHDIGKIGVPDAVLLKPSRLTEDEWVLMKAHTELGERIFRATFLHHHESIATVIRNHHEAFDGSGYPDGLTAEKIPLPCRIIRIVDSYDAMATGRPYQKARCHREIMNILDSESGTKLDPEVFREFSKLIAHNPLRAQ